MVHVFCVGYESSEHPQWEDGVENKCYAHWRVKVTR